MIVKIVIDVFLVTVIAVLVSVRDLRAQPRRSRTPLRQACTSWSACAEEKPRPGPFSGVGGNPNKVINSITNTRLKRQDAKNASMVEIHEDGAFHPDLNSW